MTIEEVLAATSTKLDGLVAVGLLVGVLHQGQQHFLSFGRERPNGESPTGDTVFALGSVTKPFTAAAAMELVGIGELDLDAPLRTRMPSLRLSDEAATASLTLRHLLTHSAGWPGDWFGAFDPGIEDSPTSLEEQVERLHEVPVLTEPGAVYSYNNLALVLTGRLIEVVTGQPYEDAVHALVLAPLGLTRTGFTTRASLSSAMTPGYVWRDGSWQQAGETPTGGPVPRIHSPSGGLLSTARDMLRFMGRFLKSDSTASTMLMPQLRSVGPRQMGLGWSLLQADPLIFRHGGGMAGFVASCAGSPASGTAVVALANWEGADTAVLTAEAAVMEALAGARYRFRPADPPPASRLEEYAGSYRLPTGRRYDIEVAGDRLQVYGGDPAPDGHWNPAGFGKQTVGLVDQDWGVVEGDGAVSPLIGFELKDGRTTAVNVGGRWFPKTTWLLESPPERIEVDGYYLRLWRSEDAQALAEALKASIGQIRPWMPFFSQEAFGREAAYVQAWAAAARDGRGFGYGLFRGRDGQLVGGTLVHILPDRPGTFDLGYWIHVDFAGQGLGRSAAGATAEAMLALADVDRMEVQCDESNAPSAAIARSLGCRLETVETLEGGGRLMRWAMEKTVPRKISSDKTR